MPKAIRIVLVESTDIFRKSFSIYLESYKFLDVTLTFTYLSEEHFPVINLNADILIFDLTDNDQRNLRLFDLIKSQLSSKVKTIALSSYENLHQNFFLAKYYSINAFFSKSDVDPKSIIDVIGRLRLETPSEIIVEDSLKENFIVNWFETPLEYTFTNKEKLVLNEVLKGSLNREIASALNVSIRTVETHRKNIIERTDSKNMIGAIIKAIKWGHLFK